MNDLMHYFTRAKVKCNSMSGRPRHRGVKVRLFTNRHEIAVLLPNPFDDIQVLSTVYCMELL